MRNIFFGLLFTLCGSAQAQELKVIAFDCFGTVFNFADLPLQEKRDYIRQLKQTPWKPLELPASWETMPAHPDSREGLERLRRHYVVVTCSNGPAPLLVKMSRNAGINWDMVLPLELIPAYKPDPQTYEMIAKVLGVLPSEVLMVTGNEGSPDLVVPRTIGMRVMRIRGEPGTPQTIGELADLLEP